MTETVHVDERLVAEIWERQLFHDHVLQDLGLRVIFRGVPSDAGGPDYQDALVARGEREILQGDVEFHVSAGDWYTHGHHLNARYDNVILHVVWTADGERTMTSSGRSVPILALEGTVLAPFNPRPPLLTHPCVSAFTCLSPDLITQRVAEAGRERFAGRAEHFACEVQANSADQAIYTALLEACGYASNRAAFRDLAEAAPFAWLAGLPSHQWLPALLGAAGLEPAPFALPARLPPEAWRIRRLRPANHPSRRLAGMAKLLERLGPRPADRLVDAVANSKRPSELRKVLVAGDEGQAYIGAGRADEMAVSVVLPFVAGYVPEVRSALTLFERYPAPPSTRWTRLMQGLLRQAGHEFPVRRAVHHQGLHGHYHTHCRMERSPGCPICGSARR